jgi:V8-like Glu-specific endopeptidase
LPPGIFNQILDPSTVAGPIAKATAAIVKVERPAADILGTGFFLGDGSTLVTNAHVLGPQECLATGCTIRIHSGQFKGNSGQAASTWLTLVPYAFSQRFDMAVFQTFVDRAATRKYIHPAFFPFDQEAVKRAEGSTKVGANVALVGHPLGYLIKVTNGRIASLSGSFVSSELLTFAGTSGGTILDEQGNFLALHHRGTQKLDYLRNNGYFGISLSTDAQEIARQLNPVVRAAGLKVFLKAEDITSDELAKQYGEALINGNSTNAPVLVALPGPAGGSALAEKLWSRCTSGDSGSESSKSSTANETAAQSPCILAVRTLSCAETDGASDLPEAPQQICPNQSQKDVWMQRFAEREQSATTEGSLFWKVTAPLRITPKPEIKAKVDATVASWLSLLKNENISIGINEAVTVMDLTHSNKVGSQDVTNWFKDFRKTENYYYAYPQFLRGLFLLGRDGFESAAAARNQLQQTRKDPSATILDALLADYLDWRLDTVSKGPIRGSISDSVYGLP